METAPAPNKREMENRYQVQLPFYEAVLDEIERRVCEIVEADGLHPVMKYRVKSFDSLFDKCLRLRRKSEQVGTEGSEPPINDVIAMRIICPFLEDLKTVEQIISECFAVVEIERKGAERNFSEFGYDSIHVLIEIPGDLKKRYPALDISICEIQIRTILQEAWAEVEHELVYKARFDPKDDPMRRKLAAINANLTLSDLIFQDIRDYQRKFMREISTRRENFFSKVQDKIDGEFFEEEEQDQRSENDGGFQQAVQMTEAEQLCFDSIDDLLLKALTAHNKSDFSLAIEIYSEILKRSPKDQVEAVVREHRGMAYFAQSRYEEALADFSGAMELEPNGHKAAYYHGVVNCVLLKYEQAIQDFDLAISIEPYHFYYYFRRAQAYFHIADYPRALSDCDSALGLSPEDQHANQLKGMIMARLKF